MRGKQRLNLAKGAIAEYLASDSAPQVFKQRDLEKILHERRAEWNLPQNLSRTGFIDYLTEFVGLEKVVLEAESLELHAGTGVTYQPLTRYVAAEATPYEVALSLRPRGYLSHGTAAFLTGLSEDVPGVIYANQEQTPKPPNNRATLTQDSIDRAFRKEARRSRYVYRYGNYRIALLSGKDTERDGVTRIVHMRPGPMPVLEMTGIARTLIDLAVRPIYGGGPRQVIEAYRRGLEKDVQVGQLLAQLRRLDYTYPYHQALGFYLEAAGCETSRLDPLRRMPREFNFYLDHAMDDHVFISDWRIYVPAKL
jgi:hypothetical protein